MIPVFIGYDSRETVAYHVAAQSILSRASSPVTISPLVLSSLNWSRRKDANQSTEFAFSRFLIPALCGFRGWAIFMDCDVLCLDDITKLWALRDEKFAVQVVKHDHQPRETMKFLGQPQSCYPKKNWSSVMLFNCARCTVLMPEFVQTATGLDLHRFNWVSEDLVGSLPRRWNHLVDYDAPLPAGDVSLLHYTSGGPWFKESEECGYADLWKQERASMMS
jgi:lipopolysaccharide biosynthesis glycosyltransferase